MLIKSVKNTELLSTILLYSWQIIFIVLAVPAYYFVNAIVGLWKIGSAVDRIPGPKKNWLKGNLHQVAWDPIHEL